MRRPFKKGLFIVFSVLAGLLLFAGCQYETTTTESGGGSGSGSSSSGSSGSGGSSGSSFSVDDTLAKIVSTKYASTSDATWGCHDPKLFQDDDGTYYVYSTGWADGVQIRSSQDLVNWTKLSNAFAGASGSSQYPKAYWDDDFLKWVGYAKNDKTKYTASYGGDSYTSGTTPNSWAPTVIKQGGKYYMLHGIITDSMVSSETDWNSPNYVNPAACITLAISDSATGPFIPASTYDSDTYSQSSLVRYIWPKNDSSIKSDSAIGYSGCYNRGNGSWTTGFGCIDPEFIYDIATGKPVEYTVGLNTCYGILYGSWKGGLAVIFVDAQTFKPVCTVAGTSSFDNKEYSVGDEMDAPVDSISGNAGIKIAGGNGTAYEGAQLVYNSDTKYYYLFTSMGNLTYEYRVGVGRSSATVTTHTPSTIPTSFLDASGRDMSKVVDKTGQTLYYHNVGSKIIGAQMLSEEYGFTSPGGLSVFRSSDGKILFANHARTTYRDSGNFMLQIHQLFFTEGGWPVLNQNDFYDDYSGYTSDGTETLSKLSMTDIAGTYETILTERSNTKADVISASDKKSVNFSAADAVATASKAITISPIGAISGAYTGTLSLASDGYSATITLDDYGTFRGYFLHAVDWARKSGSRRTVTFTTLSSTTSDTAAGEYFWGNRTEAAESEDNGLTSVAAGLSGSVTGGAWWNVFASASDIKVASKTQVMTKFTVTAVNQNNETNNYTCAPDVVLRNSSKEEYAVVRADNYGWKGTDNTNDNLSNLGWSLSSDWDWDSFVSFVNGSTVTLTIKNYGTGSADVLYDFVKDGTTHYQYYENIAVTADDLYMNLVLEYCNVTFCE